MRKFFWTWAVHAALNLGEALKALYHVVLPPQVDHSPEALAQLYSSDPLSEFLRGAGLVEEGES